MPFSVKKMYGRWRMVRVMSELNVIRIRSYKIGKNSNKIQEKQKDKGVSCKRVFPI
jgi:hypothetical protein